MKLTNLLPILAITGLMLLCLGQPLGLVMFVLAALLCGAKLQPTLYSFPNNCSGRLIAVSPSTGCTLSKATVQPWTTTDLENNALKEVGYDLEYGRLVEFRKAGYVESSLMTLVLSKVANVKNLIKTTVTRGNKSIVFPFLQRFQDRNININYFIVASGIPNAQAGAGGVHPGAWDLTINNQTGAFATTLPTISNYFLPGRALLVEYQDATSSEARTLQYEVLSSTQSGTSAIVTVKPNYSASGWNALTAPQKLVYQIGGVNGGNAASFTAAYIGANSVSDWESYKEKDTAINSGSVLHYALQTSRLVWDYTDEWLKLLKNPLMGTYFQRYWQMDEARQRRQHQELFEKALLNSVMFGQRESEKQNPLTDDWRDLPTVNDPANSNCILAYKTRAEGILTQLMNCSRMSDRANGNILLQDLFSVHYLLCRAREAEGGRVEETDWMTDFETAGQFERLMMEFYKLYYKNSTTVYIESGKVVNPEVNLIFGFKRYPLPIEYGGGAINVYHERFFDDRRRALGGIGSGSTSNVQRFFVGIDWSDFIYGVVETAQRMTETFEGDEMYRYIIKINKAHAMLSSITWTAMIQDPLRSYFYRNFAGFTDNINNPGGS